MSKILDTYAGAVARGDLSSDDRSTFRGADVVGAFGLAGRKHKLAAALARMFIGGDREAKEVSAIMTRMLVSKAHDLGEPIGEAAADLIAGIVLEWHRNSTCPMCKGHGFRTVAGELGESRAVIGSQACRTCKGRRVRPFDPLFPAERLSLARWLRDKVERETALAGPAALRYLRLDLK